MATHDKCCSIVPYSKVAEGKPGTFKGLCEQFVEKTRDESKCLGSSPNRVGRLPL